MSVVTHEDRDTGPRLSRADASEWSRRRPMGALGGSAGAPCRSRPHGGSGYIHGQLAHGDTRCFANTRLGLVVRWN